MTNENSTCSGATALVCSKTHIEYFQTIAEAKIKTCCQQWQRESQDVLILALVAEIEADKVVELQGILKSMAIPLIGAIFPALVHAGEFKSSGVLLICLPQKILWHLQAELPQEQAALHQCLDLIIDDLQPALEVAEDSALFMLFDAMVPNIATILDELYMLLGDSVHYMGVNAGSETFQPMPCLFDSERIVQNGVLVMLFSPHKGAILEHGYEVPRQTIIATSTTGNRISSIDWRPAFDVYRERVQQQYAVEINRDNFYQHAVHFPFGIVRADKEVLVRIPVMLDDDYSLVCVGEIPENSVLTLLDAPQAQSLDTVNRLADKLDEHPVNLLFYCAGRRMHLLDAADNELKDLQQKASDRLNAGALSLGEIGSSRKGGYPLFHNATLVSFPLI
jgi:hypothetical protein